MFEWFIGLLMGFTVGTLLALWIVSSDNYGVERCAVVRQTSHGYVLRSELRGYDRSSGKIGKNCVKVAHA
jgi:hypothetical protein